MTTKEAVQHLRALDSVAIFVPPLIERLNRLADELERKFSELGPAKRKPQLKRTAKDPQWREFLSDQADRSHLLRNYDNAAILLIAEVAARGALIGVDDMISDDLRIAQPKGRFAPRTLRIALRCCRDQSYGIAPTLRVRLSLPSADTVGSNVADAIRYFAGMAQNYVLQSTDGPTPPASLPPHAQSSANEEPPDLPSWNADAGELTYRGEKVLTLKSRAKLLRSIVAALQAGDWQPIVTPTNARGDNLRQAISSLNKRSTGIKFQQTDGKLVRWEHSSVE
jgi:hypothetical protein